MFTCITGFAYIVDMTLTTKRLLVSILIAAILLFVIKKQQKSIYTPELKSIDTVKEIVADTTHIDSNIQTNTTTYYTMQTPDTMFHKPMFTKKQKQKIHSPTIDFIASDTCKDIDSVSAQENMNKNDTAIIATTNFDSLLFKQYIDSIKKAYAHEIAKLIEHHKVYPKPSLRLKETGGILLVISILKNGDVEFVHIDKKCQFENLNKAASDAAYNASPYPAFPDTLPDWYMEINVPVKFR